MAAGVRVATHWKWIVVVLLLTLSSYPALEGLYAGQLGLLVAFLLPASVLALQRKRFLLAGILMALTTMKPQEMGLVIIYFLLWVLPDWRTRNRFCVGFMVTLALLVGTSLAVMPHWIHSWISTVMAYRGYNPAPLVKTVLTSPLGPRLAGPAALFVTGAFLIVAGFVAWRHRDAGVESSEFWLTMGLLLCITTIVILPGQAVYDHVILLPAILLLIRSRDALSKAGLVPRVLLWIGAVVLFWPWVAAFGVSVVRVFLRRPSIRACCFCRFERRLRFPSRCWHYWRGYGVSLRGLQQPRERRLSFTGRYCSEARASEI